MLLSNRNIIIASKNLRPKAIVYKDMSYLGGGQVFSMFITLFFIYFVCLCTYTCDSTCVWRLENILLEWEIELQLEASWQTPLLAELSHPSHRRFCKHIILVLCKTIRKASRVTCHALMGDVAL